MGVYTLKQSYLYIYKLNLAYLLDDKPNIFLVFFS
uniref:Uncharacterized protein n=1 Tax=viral metagenome TaxID=1070528 RepID=A0A6C0HLE7_9ZZZZ